MIPLFGAKSDFSTGESIVAVDTLAAMAKDNGYTSLALADTFSVNGMVSLTKACQKRDIKPIIGASLKVVDDLSWRRAGRGEPKRKPNPFFNVTLYAKNAAGMQRIISLLTTAHGDGNYYYTPQIDLDQLLQAADSGDTLLATGCATGLFSHPKAHDLIEILLARIDRSDIMAEYIPVDSAYYDRYNAAVLECAETHGLIVTMARPVYYQPDQVVPRNTLHAILNRDTVDSRWRQEPASDLTIKAIPDALADFKASFVRVTQRYRHITPPNALSVINNTKDFADKVSFVWQPMDVSLPKMSSDPTKTLVQKAMEGFKRRLTVPVSGYKPDSTAMPEYVDRLHYELSVLKKMGFENYFLLVEHLVGHCKREGIMVGPGRGSVGGSLVAFLLGITDIDPIRFGLIFERFINPERLDLPDIDLDFMTSRRQEVVTWLVSHYGEDQVAGISNYSRLGAASALRQVASAHNVPAHEFSISKQLQDDVSLEDSAQLTPDIESFSSRYPDVWTQACQLQGAMRNYSQHAAGIIVAGEPVSNRAVVDTHKEGLPLVNWDKRVVEDMGLIKLDVLGLATLDLLYHAMDYAKQTSGLDIQYTQLCLDDRATLDAFGRGETEGIFQFTSGGMKHLLKELAIGAPLNFEDLMAATALHRPGPMESGLMEQYVQIAQGAVLESYVNEAMRPALEKTRGVIVYQESVMQLSRDLAGFSMAQADGLRKAMGKKDPAIMANYRDQWNQGCIKHSSMPEKQATDLFEQIEKFAGYAFNKSHSATYAQISYWAMYMKVHHPAAFFAAALTVLDEDKRPGVVRDAQSHGLTVMPPDINISSDRFEIGPDGLSLYAPFQVVKGLSEKGAKAIIAAKTALGSVKSKQEFIDTVNRRSVNVRVQGALDSVGAFASVEPGTPDILDTSRLVAQKDLLPGLMTQQVKDSRTMVITQDSINALMDEFNENALMVSAQAQAAIIELYSDEESDDMGKAVDAFNTVQPFVGAKAKIMVVLDCPSWQEAKESEMATGDSWSSISKAMSVSGITKEQVYVTSLIRCPKPKNKEIPNSLINLYSPVLDREIDVLKPSAIVCLGGKSIRHVSPEAKGKWEELCGQSHYDSQRKSTVIWGMSPGMIYFEPSRQKLLDDLFKQAKEVIA